MTTFLGYTLHELARLQIELEYRLTSDGLLVPQEGSAERNRCCLYLNAAGMDAYFRPDVPASARRTVARLTPQEVLAAPDVVSAHVGGRAVARHETYLVLEPFRATCCLDARLIDGKAIIEGPDERAVSWAWSVRESDHAAECAVETVESFRRRGFATQVIAAWANQALANGKVPFYSHSACNDASRALAARLGLAHVFTVLGITWTLRPSARLRPVRRIAQSLTVAASERTGPGCASVRAVPRAGDRSSHREKPRNR